MVMEATGFASRKIGAPGNAGGLLCGSIYRTQGWSEAEGLVPSPGCPAFTVAKHFSKHLTHTTASQPSTRVLSVAPFPG